jgi:pimeloyl-ACP methyl ester carboxylesterase
MTLVVPFFDPVNFPEYETFNLHGMRSDKRLLELLDHLGERAEVRTKEFYLIGLGDGGDFVQRFAFFYPERIARAAFTTTFFYPLEVKQYFPIGLKSTPLAPDLKVDFLKIIKTDFAYILDPYQGGQKEFKTFQSQMQEYVLKSQHVPRIRYRELTDKNNSMEGVLRVAKDFLFPPIND